MSLQVRHSAFAGRAALIVLGLVAAPAVHASPAAPATPTTPTAPEITIADERLEASYNSGADFIRYPALDAYLAQVVRRLQDANADAATVTIRIHALRSALPYAFVLDNGACYVSTGLLARLADEQQLAASIALPLAGVIRLDRKALSASSRQRGFRNFLPNLLVLTVTAGLGAPALMKADTMATSDEQSRLQTASDAVALRWLSRAGYDPKSAPASLRRLRELLTAEQRSGAGELSDPAALAARAESLERALTDIEGPPVVMPPVDPTGNFVKLSVYYAIRQAAEDVDGHPVSVEPLLTRIEASQGETGQTSFLRAELRRRNSADLASVPAAIQAYERCIGHADAPVAAYRELAFLYRRIGDEAHARQNFSAYLAHAPNATDAPIIRTYLEHP